MIDAFERDRDAAAVQQLFAKLQHLRPRQRRRIRRGDNPVVAGDFDR